jgi:hypothetical protein
MLTAYFDDSGTHAQSEIVLVGGICGTEWQLKSLDRMWAKLLERPLCGRKRSLRRFHMTECQDSRGEFERWNRAETDHFCYQLGTAIIESGVSAYGIACTRKDWDDLITGDVRAIFGSAEQMCIRNCFVQAIKWAEDTTFDRHMTFVFDNRPSHIQTDAQVVSHAFENGRVGEDGRPLSPQITGTAFLNSYQVRPLQAADLIAWELYQFANDIYAHGATEPNRLQLKRLMKEIGYFPAQITSRESIENIIDHVANQDQKKIKAAAEHFKIFDPSKPDFSHPGRLS